MAKVSSSKAAIKTGEWNKKKKKKKYNGQSSALKVWQQ